MYQLLKYPDSWVLFEGVFSLLVSLNVGKLVSTRNFPELQSPSKLKINFWNQSHMNFNIFIAVQNYNSKFYSIE